MPTDSINQPQPGDLVRVIGTDATKRVTGELHHINRVGQGYILPDNDRQPFYAFLADLEVREPRSAEPEDIIEREGLGGTGPSEAYVQRVYVRHMAGKKRGLFG